MLCLAGVKICREHYSRNELHMVPAWLPTLWLNYGGHNFIRTLVSWIGKTNSSAHPPLLLMLEHSLLRDSESELWPITPHILRSESIGVRSARFFCDAWKIFTVVVLLHRYYTHYSTYFCLLEKIGRLCQILCVGLVKLQSESRLCRVWSPFAINKLNEIGIFVWMEIFWKQKQIKEACSVFCDNSIQNSSTM